MTVTIAATDYAQRAIAVRFFSELATRAPRIRMALVLIGNANLPLQFECGKIDLALMTADTAPQGLHGRRLLVERDVCVMRAGHPVAHTHSLLLKQFARTNMRWGRWPGPGSGALPTMRCRPLATPAG